MSNDALRRAFDILFDLSHQIVEKSAIEPESPFYRLSIQARDDLAGFLTDFHDDNEPLWNLLTDEQKRRSGA